ncbi:DUF1467 family protein [Qipengyuania atrilutea]|uniref:DUF1467 family protein n=1 Tax=Qipengyuania atrilutea TaxID=2744473 RepID=A0A850H1S7_9SPHN|nr:DUF1467 family protein [Actirhodobacter atriluteus]NVD43878.1 DUF1467 family protein [Actirhodobacter atriluteus]
MQWTSILAIYLLMWIACAFLMLPFGIRTHEEVGEEKIPGQADSAPANFRPGRVVVRATVLAAAVTALYVVNYDQGWIEAEDINIFGDPPSLRED